MTITLETQNLLFVLTAPSGGGKTTICRALLDSDAGLGYSISTTTRPPRPGESQGVAYDFVSLEAFQQLDREGAFLESACVHGHWYGTRRDRVAASLAQGRDLVMDIDVQGAFSIRAALAEAVLIFILPPSMSVLEARLRARASDSDDVVARRLENARQEIVEAHRFDYLVVNADLGDTIGQIHSILTAERLRAARRRIVCRGEGPLDAIYPERPDARG